MRGVPVKRHETDSIDDMAKTATGVGEYVYKKFAEITGHENIGEKAAQDVKTEKGQGQQYL